MIRIVSSVSVFVFLVLAAALHGRAEDIARLEEMYGPHDLAMVSGMGGLTVGVNARGRVSVCSWPSPGFNTQVSYRTYSRDEPMLGVEPGDGLLWGIRFDGELVWMNDPRWIVQQNYAAPSNTIMITQARWPDSRIVVTQRVSVVHNADAFVSEIAVNGLPTQPEFYWYANFTPSTRHVPEIPGAYRTFDGLDDFAAFTDRRNGRVVHFRPRAPGREDWAFARGIMESEDRHGYWPSFRNGTWIVYQAGEGIRSAFCGSGSVSPSEAVGHLVDSRDGESSATGQCYSAVKVAPRKDGRRFVASIAVAFADNFEESTEILDTVMSSGTAALLRATAQFQDGLLTHATYPAADDPRIKTYLRRAVLTLRTATDLASGATVRSPADQPPLARDWPKHGAWMVYALDLSGSPVLAQRHLDFYLDAVRTRYARGKPIGSIASSLYTDGVEASPHLIVDDGAVAWLLWALNLHGDFLTGARRSSYFKSIWEGTELCADFLAGWKDRRRGAPLWAPDPITFRDNETRERLFAAKLGMDGALAIAKTIGHEAPRAWFDRQRQIDDLVRGILLERRTDWPVGEMLPMFLLEFGETDIQAADLAVTLRLEALDTLSGYEAAKAFSDAAMLWRNEPRRLEELRGYAFLALRNALSDPIVDGFPDLRRPAFPDALAAAHSIVAAHIVYGNPPSAQKSVP